MANIQVVPDTEYDLERINERFAVPFDACPNESDTKEQALKKLLFIEAIGNKTAHEAITIYERVRHWRFRDDMDVELDESELQFDHTDYQWATPNPVANQAVDAGQLFHKLNKKYYVMKLWFEVPKIRKFQNIPDSHTEGAVTEEDMKKLQANQDTLND